jgi:purine nucleosidase
MMPLDVTHKVLTTRVRVERLRANGNRPSLAMANMLEFFERFDEEKYGTDGGPLHDPTVIAWLIDPGMFYRSPLQCGNRRPAPILPWAPR